MMTVSFASLAYENKKKKTRREKFLEEMNQVIPWAELLQIIKGYYPQGWQRAAADADRKDATDIFYAAMVRTV